MLTKLFALCALLHGKILNLMASRIQQFTTAPEVVGYLLKHLHRMTSSVCRVLLHRVCVCVTSLKRRSLGVLCFIVLFTLLMVLYFNFFLLVNHCVTLHFKKCLYYMNLTNFSGVSVKSNLASMIRQGVARHTVE